jgi:Fic family protein
VTISGPRSTNRESSAAIDPREADAAYKPFPSFAEWSTGAVDANRWDRYLASFVERRRGASAELLRKSLEIVKRAAAVDTGAIEGLYQTDRGFTFTVAMQAATWQAAFLEKQGDTALWLFESQLHAYDYVLDLATKRVPIAEAWIRSLHAEVCKSQDTYEVWTEIGIQTQELPKGEYKHLPNHVMTASGSVHAYAPVDLTPAEMHRLCAELRSQKFEAAHPVLQASYAHYALVAIHPFADGNGRVARALASVFTYRSASVPLLILVEDTSDYRASLRAADAGRYQPFTDFIAERTLDAIQLANESLRVAGSPSLDEAVAQLNALYRTKGGYSQDEVDQAGYRLFDRFVQEVSSQISALPKSNLWRFSLSAPNAAHTPHSGYRLPGVEGPRRFDLHISTVPPAMAAFSWQFVLEVPRDSERDDTVAVRNLSVDDDLFEARLAEVIPGPSSALQMRLSVAVEGMIRRLLVEASKRAASALEA